MSDIFLNGVYRGSLKDGLKLVRKLRIDKLKKLLN